MVAMRFPPVPQRLTERYDMFKVPASPYRNERAKSMVMLPALLMIRYLKPASTDSHFSFLKATSM